jgi:predicted  nucleic acid-binding Zn-ribbon protein
MLENYFIALNNEWYRFKEETENLKSEVANLKAKNKRLQQAVDNSNKHLSPVVTLKRTKHAPQKPRTKAA